VLDHKRIVDVRTVFKQTDATDCALGTLAGKAHEGLVAHHAPTGEHEIL
jgi:hypothetical protein